MVAPQKEENVSILTEKFKKMNGLILTDYHGLKVSEVDELRRNLKKISCQYMIVKNTIASRVLEKVEINDMVKEMSGPTAVLIINGDPILAAKKVVDFSKEHEKLKIKSGHFFGKVVSTDEINRIAALPTREILLGKFTNTLKMCLGSLVNVLQAPIKKFVCVMDVISKKSDKK